MTYRDFAGGTAVFDRQGRRGALVFDEDPASQPTIGDCGGWVAFEVRPGGQRERLSVRTTWDHADTVIGPLYRGAYRGPNIPADYKGPSAADLDVILARLSAARLVP